METEELGQELTERVVGLIRHAAAGLAVAHEVRPGGVPRARRGVARDRRELAQAGADQGADEVGEGCGETAED